MAVHNCAEFVADALGSILSQTFTDFEVIVVDDGSTDDSAGEVERMSDERVSLVRLDRPSGDLALALSVGVSRSRGEFVARMDADDISYSTRLERQVATMQEHPDLVLLGTWADALDRDRNQTMVSRPPCEDTAIRFILNYRCPYHHPSVMLRRGALDAAGGYRTGYLFAEDYDLWRRMLDHGRVGNLPEVLVAQRYYPASSSGRNKQLQDAHSDQIGVEMVSRAIGRRVSEATIQVLRDQTGAPQLRRLAGATLLDLYRSCAQRRDFSDMTILKTTAANEMIDMAITPGAGAAAASLWANAVRIDPRTAALRGGDLLKEDLRRRFKQ
jgi:glycosyltransferase involved in cell wall biosynthesis